METLLLRRFLTQLNLAYDLSLLLFWIERYQNKLLKHWCLALIFDANWTEVSLWEGGHKDHPRPLNMTSGKSLAWRNSWNSWLFINWLNKSNQIKLSSNYNIYWPIVKRKYKSLASIQRARFSQKTRIQGLGLISWKLHPRAPSWSCDLLCPPLICPLMLPPPPEGQ
jgi:hypothetical protein